MKKLLPIHSLLLLPLVTSSIVISMEKKRIFSSDQLKELHELTLFQQQQKLHATPDDSDEYQIPTKPLIIEDYKFIESEIETIDIKWPEHKTTIQTKSNDALAQSVILPTEEKPLSWKELLAYKMSTSYQHLQRMITSLQNDQFDTTNLTHLNWLNEAVATANSNKDIESLLAIADVCENKYKNQIRVSEEVAQPAFELLNQHYTKQLLITHKELQNERQKQMKEWNITTAASIASIYKEINLYNQKMNDVSNNYHTAENQHLKNINDLQKKIETFSILNKEIRKDTIELIKENQVKTPKNIFAATMKESEKKLNSIQKTLEEIPTIKEAQIKPQSLVFEALF